MTSCSFDTYGTLDTPVGRVLLVGAGETLTGVYLERQRDIPDVAHCTPRRCAGMERARAQLERYFAGERLAFEVPPLSVGTPFQRDVWRALSAIPFGETRSYEAVAEAVGRPRAVRAVGTAVARNPLAIVIPCHRVVAKSGALAGFAGGLDCKRWLLEHEGAAS